MNPWRTMLTGRWSVSAAADRPDGRAPAGWRPPAPGFGGALVALASATGRCPDVPTDQWVTAPDAAAADTASAVTAVALAGLPCSADGLRGRGVVCGWRGAGRAAGATLCWGSRCRVRAAGPEGWLCPAGRRDGLRCRAGELD